MIDLFISFILNIVSNIVSTLFGNCIKKCKDREKICSYLQEVLKKTRDDHPSFKLMAKDGIDEKLFSYPENEQLIPSLGIAGQKVAPIWKLIKAEHKEGFRHIIIEGDGGIGKSVSLMSVTDDSELLSRIPAIYIHMYELCKDDNCLSLDDYIRENYPSYADKILLLASDPAGKPTIMLILDGLNEVKYDLQGKLLREIKKWTKFYCGAQLIVASRPIPGQQLESILTNPVHIRLKPLEKECVKERLKTFGVISPDDSSPIWETLKLPLFLTLYAKTANLYDYTSGYPIAIKREPVGPATIIWNYLQRELLRKEEDSWILNCAFACEYISPEIAYKMALLNRFELSRDESQQFVDDEAVYTTNRLPEHLSQIKECYIEKQTELPPKVNWKNFVFKETGIFVAPKRWTYKKETDKYSFMHQSFRDCLAGLHLVNVAQMARSAKEGGELPSEWKSSIPPLVLDYAAELMDADSAQKLWELNRKRCVKGAKIDNTSTYMQLELHRRLKTESGKLDFSGMDLRGMSLTNYMGGEYDLGLFASPKLVSGTCLDRKVFQSEGHHGAINCIISLDNRYIASASDDKIIKIWDPNTGECIQTLEGHSGPITCLALLPDGKLVSGSRDNSIRIWNTETCECIRTFTGHSDLNCLAVLTDGHIVSGSDNHTICIWDTETGKCTGTLTGHSAAITCLAALPDGDIFSCSLDQTIQIWNTKTGKSIKIFTGHFINCLAVLPNGNIVSSSLDQTIQIWNTKTGKSIKTFTGRFISCLTTLADGYIVSGSPDNTIQIWNAETGKCIKTLEGHSNSVTCLAALADGRIVSGSRDKTVRIWNTETGKCIRILVGNSHGVNCLATFPDGRIVSGARDNTIRIWNPNTGKCTRTLTCHYHGGIGITCLAILPNGLVVSGSRNNAIQIWNAETGKCTKTIEVHSKSVDYLIILDDWNIVFSNLFSNTIQIWNMKTGKHIKTLEGDFTSVYCLALLPDGRIISGSLDNTIQIWNAKIGKCIKTLEGHSNSVTCLAALSDDRMVSGSRDKTIRIWNPNEGKCIKTFGEHSSSVCCLTILPDNRIVSGSEDNTIKIWDPNKEESIKTLEGHTDKVTCILPLTNGHIVSSSEDNTIRIWDPNTGECLDILEPTEVDVSKMDFSEAIMTKDTAKLLYQNGAIVQTSFIEEE